MSTFSDPDTISSYARMAERNVPALRDLHRMVSLLLAERVPTDGRVLVLGAGGGLELRAMAGLNPGWSFDGVDPSPQMLDQARAVTREFANRITLHEGYIEDAPEGPFDGATCLLTLHFISREGASGRSRRQMSLSVRTRSFSQSSITASKTKCRTAA